MECFINHSVQIRNLRRHYSDKAFAVETSWWNIGETFDEPICCREVAKNTIGCYENHNEHEVNNFRWCFIKYSDANEVPLATEDEIRQASKSCKPSQLLPGRDDADKVKQYDDHYEWIHQWYQQVAQESSQKVSCRRVHLAGQLTLHDWRLKWYLYYDVYTGAYTQLIGYHESQSCHVLDISLICFR